MPILKNNCTSGELSPKVHQRGDIQQFQNGLATCLNAIVSPYGGVYRRFGTKYIATAKYGDRLCIMRPFEFSITQAYVLEIGDCYIRFYKDGAQIVDAGTGDPIEVETTYREDELRELRFEQSADVLYIFHPNHYPAKLTRSSHVDWTLEDCDFTGGPFLDENEDEDITLAASAVTGTGITVTASEAMFEGGHIGSLWKLSSGKSTDEVIESKTEVGVTGHVGTSGDTVEIEISGAWQGKAVTYRSFNNGTDWYAYQTIRGNCVKRYEDTRAILYRVALEGYVSGPVNIRLSTLDPEEEGQGTFKITAVASNGLSCTADVIEEIRSTDATRIWAEAAWSGVRGYPRAGKIYEGRLVCACTDDDPTGVWGSSSLEYENMKLGTNDDEAFYFSLDAKGGVSVVKWLEAWKHLAVGTHSGEVRLVSSNGITPSNPPDKKSDSSYGSAEVQGFVAGRAIVFVDRSGRILREYSFDYDSDAFDSPSISMLAEHILNNGGGVVDVAYQQKQDSIIWCVLDDGTLGALTYLPAQEVNGWHRHRLGGQSFAESICVIPGTYGHDELWLSVRRNINKQTVRYIELMNEDETGWMGKLPTPVIIVDVDGMATITCSASVASIYFTLDESTPDKGSFLYQGEFDLNLGAGESATIKAIAIHEDYIDSNVATEVYPSGALWAAGSNYYNQLGLSGAGYSDITLVAATEFLDVQTVVSNTLALTRDGQLCGAGDNDRYSLGDSTYGTIESSGFSIRHASLFKKIAHGRYHSAAIDREGNLWVVGYNFDGQLGLGDKVNRSEWTQVSDVLFVDIACVGDETFCLKSDGTLWGAGNNVIGSTGYTVFTKIGTATYSSIRGAYLFIRTDGSMWGYQLNTYGQLGFAATSWVDGLTQESLGYAWLMVRMGESHSMAIKIDGTLWAAGLNSNGQLGLGDTTNREAFTCVNAEAWKYVACGGNSSLAIKSDGTLWGAGDSRCWGGSGNVSALTQISDEKHVLASCSGWTGYGASVLLRSRWAIEEEP